ncbi:nucleoside 2-deoxyribosyltransferase domain-containing protein [Romboutsia sp. Marseille-P6047]|uniref:nucleoside 2-deoxyribosyltransferase domain-containing protein n=1 Tax=Romboutsia sp. Marseille-P6047 TaxID=2161817 RepID=UPI000F057B22|nr:nucleoside 2-deoxyribosyltransferase domain-containing protein [Romboutsia sp. Marseille-P6047]
MKKVFLGGTCNGSTWREELIELLEIDYFNPVVDDWTEERMKEEIRQRETCDYCLYVITPRMTGVYSIAEVVDDSNKRPERTVFCVLKEDVNPALNYTTAIGTSTHIYFNKGQLKSLEQVGKMVRKNGGKYFRTLEDVAEYLNA